MVVVVVTAAIVVVVVEAGGGGGGGGGGRCHRRRRLPHRLPRPIPLIVVGDGSKGTYQKLKLNCKGQSTTRR